MIQPETTPARFLFGYKGLDMSKRSLALPLLALKFAPDWVPFAWGDYWILALEDAYSAALVGSPDGEYLWILTREVTPAQPTIDRMLNAAREKGFATEPLVWRQ